MADAEKTVFISYRRSASKHLARAIFMDLREHGYDVFLDVTTIDSGAFDTIILNQIAARAHFVVLLSPGALERCANEDDWLRREIEEALRLKRNIVPVIEEGFDFEAETGYLPEVWREEFKRFNGPRLFHDYFEAGMETLRTRFLKQPVYEVAISPTPTVEREEVQQRIAESASLGWLTEFASAEQPTQADDSEVDSFAWMTDWLKEPVSAEEPTKTEDSEIGLLDDVPDWFPEDKPKTSTPSDIPDWLKKPVSTEEPTKTEELGIGLLNDFIDWFLEDKPKTNPQVRPNRRGRRGGRTP